MKICAAQTRPVTGDIPANITNHKRLIDLAVAAKADLIIFPELSLTGYEPSLAGKLAVKWDDARLDVFQKISDTRHLTIGVGIPVKCIPGIYISMVIFSPKQARLVYSKSHLHPDEAPFFVAGQSSPDLKINDIKIALAICYEISVPQHLETALKSKPEIYFASVAKSVKGIDKACDQLSAIAKKHSLTVLMSNSIGTADGSVCAGKTSVWNNQGQLVGQLDDTNEGILIFDAHTQEAVVKTI
jgi:predicted amidohydrolase